MDDVRQRIANAVRNGISLRRQIQDEVTKIQAAERERSRQYEQLSKLVGPFDHSEMDDAEFARYGLEKLGHEMPEDDDMAPAALTYVLAEKGMRKSATGGMDASFDAPTGDGVVARYIRGES